MSDEWSEGCNTCGGTGQWESTTEENPTVLLDLGPCPECYPLPEGCGKWGCKECYPGEEEGV